MYRSLVAKKQRNARYKNEKLLEAIGEHCRQWRIRKGYTIDRVYREGEQLSTSVIHRLENGAADTQISVFYRYAQVLGLSLKELFDFDVEMKISSQILPFDKNQEKPKASVPYYEIKVAAGQFNLADKKISDIEPQGWVKVENHRQLADCFATHVYGHSMEPSIPNGALCLFRLYKGGSRQNKIFLVRAYGLLDPETDESFVIKKYKRLTPLQDYQDRGQAVVHLISENKNYPPIVLMASAEEEVEVIAEFIEVLE